MNHKEISSFVEQNLKNFEVNSTGWNDLIRQMLFEFAIGGWNTEKDVFGKEKEGELWCCIYSEDPELNEEIQYITAKYTALSAETCEICGSEGKKRSDNFQETTLCLFHYLDQKSIIEIDDDLNIKLNKKNRLTIGEIADAETEYDFSQLRLYIKKESGPITKMIDFSWQQPNYYLLLKTVPLHLFPEEQQKRISELFQNLKYCEICGYKALHQNTCLRCHYDSWRESETESEREKLNYIKACQMDIFIDENDYEKYFKYDRSFEKSPDYQILFSSSDLREYEKLLF
ncbi:hypothetical protein [Chryseobacterium sp.]|uniref:hypothetical protein n=1 Tax=Chryseobacterium sp. TaxID=1871047 RepID=UPI0025C3D80A|nr:hypothetical protein [Chryseobacterium sp.]MBV8327704.1 hypothetical protein [Chryseobacterium sp.]